MSTPKAGLPPPYDGMYTAYATALAGARLAESSKSRYLTRVRAFLSWTAEASSRGALGHDPLGDMAAAIRAAHGYHRHLVDGGYAPATIDGVLAALDDFYARRGLGVTGARRERHSGKSSTRYSYSAGPVRSNSLSPSRSMKTER